MLKPGVKTVWPTPFSHGPLKVGALSYGGQSWFVGDTAYIWTKDRYVLGYTGWVKGIIKSLYDNGMVELIMVAVQSVSVDELASIDVVRKTAHQMFPMNARVVLRAGAQPQEGMEGFVISVQDAEKHNVPGISLLAPDGYVPVILDAGYAGAWMPQVLGLIAGPKATTVPIIGEEPKNNDGRDTCFWCGAPTREFGMNFGRVCTDCGR